MNAEIVPWSDVKAGDHVLRHGALYEVARAAGDKVFKTVLCLYLTGGPDELKHTWPTYVGRDKLTAVVREGVSVV